MRGVSAYSNRIDTVFNSEKYKEMINQLGVPDGFIPFHYRLATEQDLLNRDNLKFLRYPIMCISYDGMYFSNHTEVKKYSPAKVSIPAEFAEYLQSIGYLVYKMRINSNGHLVIRKFSDKNGKMLSSLFYDWWVGNTGVSSIRRDPKKECVIFKNGCINDFHPNNVALLSRSDLTYLHNYFRSVVGDHYLVTRLRWS